ncbi:MAG: hypothetical protein HDP34_03190 [Clostridia bacterium]|nr:hypothetical protein [Clostridia bacterium]
MKSKIKPYLAACGLAAAALISFLAPNITASANSGPKNWYGTTFAGATFTGENCPLEVESELLTFDVPEFPELNVSEDYKGKVTAQYVFKNPTDSQIEATLAFPFGYPPSYCDDFDTDKFGVTIDGVSADAELRHTVSYSRFDFTSDSNKIYDGFITDKFFTEDKTVYTYEFTVTAGLRDAVEVEATFVRDKNIKYAGYGYYSSNGKTVTLKNYLISGEKFRFYSIGGEVDLSTLKWQFTNGTKVINASAKLTATTQTLFKEFVLSYRSVGSKVSDIDYYNAVVSSIAGSDIVDLHFAEFNEGSFMRWYVYKLNLEPHATCLNTVIAPLYPRIITSYKPYKYEFEYLLSPAKEWSSFGELEVRVNTPYYILDSYFEFEKTDSGYKLLLDALPEGELSFTMCAVEEPEYDSGNLSVIVLLFIIFAVLLLALPILGLPIYVVSGAVVLIVYFVKRANRKRD